mgnify:CR=1 FL=1
MNESDPELIDIRQLQPGPIRHESLSPEMLDHAKAVFDVIGPYQGPFDDDVFFVIETADKNFVIPQAAPGASQLLERFQQLPGFDNEAVIDSMGCTDNKEFVCWERRTLPEIGERHGGV